MPSVQAVLLGFQVAAARAVLYTACHHFQHHAGGMGIEYSHALNRLSVAPQPSVQHAALHLALSPRLSHLSYDSVTQA